MKPRPAHPDMNAPAQPQTSSPGTGASGSLGMRSLTRRGVVALAAAGLAIRLACAFLYGTQDMEWWKAWGSYSVRESLTGIYGAPDQEIIRQWREGKPFAEILKASQTVIPYDGYQYWRSQYRLGQPPLYIYSLYATLSAYRLVSPDLANGRWLNFFINIEPIVSTALLAVLIGAVVGALAGRAAGLWAGLVYWLNPLVILNAPIQAYRDPLCALFAVASVVMLYRRRLAASMCLLVLSFLTKPQGVLIAPVVVWVGLREHSFGRNVAAWAAAAATGLLVAAPYIISGRFLSVIVGVLSISEYSSDLSRQSMNIWWPVKYAMRAASEIRWESVSPAAAILGGPCRWFWDVPASKLTPLVGFNVQLIGAALLGAFTVLNLWYVTRAARHDRRAIFWAAALQVYGYFILRVGLQINHYFILVPLLSIACFSEPGQLRRLALVCAVFLAQDLVFYGLGRDFNPGLNLLSRFYAGWTTNVLAATNVGVFVGLAAWRYSSLASVRNAQPIC